MTTDEDEVISQHPIDRLLRELIAAPRPVTEAERRAIVEHIATAEFNRNGVTTEDQIRGLTDLGRVVRSWDDSLFVHLVRRVVVRRQWQVGTTPEMYLDDLHRIVLHTEAVVYLGRTDELPTVLIVAPTLLTVEHQGPRLQTWAVVVYAPVRGTLVSGYQARRPPLFVGSWRLQ